MLFVSLSPFPSGVRLIFGSFPVLFVHQVQSIRWHPVEEAVLLSASFDRRAAVIDVRTDGKSAVRTEERERNDSASHLGFIKAFVDEKEGEKTRKERTKGGIEMKRDRKECFLPVKLVVTREAFFLRSQQSFLHPVITSLFLFLPHL